MSVVPYRFELAPFSARRRSTREEAMDAVETSDADFAGCARDIARINALTGAYAPTLAWLHGIVRRHGPFSHASPLRVLDVGCGYGDVLRAVAAWGARAGVPLALVGVDSNPRAIRAARAATPVSSRIAYVVADAFALDAASLGPPDVTVASLFAHHLDDDGVVAFLRWATASSRIGWFVNDLHRHVLPYAFIALATRVARAHRFVRNDAPLSVARAFVRADWERALGAAGVRAPEAVVRWHPLFRHGVAWERDAPLDGVGIERS